jgi:hypothetical protein
MRENRGHDCQIEGTIREMQRAGDDKKQGHQHAEHGFHRCSVARRIDAAWLMRLVLIMQRPVLLLKHKINPFFPPLIIKKLILL